MKHLMTRGALAVALIAGWAVFATGCGNHEDHSGHDHSSHSEKAEEAHSEAAPHADGDTDANVKPYTLKTCVVSGEELGSMGKVNRFVHKGQEIKLCCKGCLKDFNKDPAKFIKKIAAAGSGK